MVNMVSSFSMTDSTAAPSPDTAGFEKREQELKDLEAGNVDDKEKYEPDTSKSLLAQWKLSSLKNLVCGSFERLVHRNADEVQTPSPGPIVRSRQYIALTLNVSNDLS